MTQDSSSKKTSKPKTPRNLRNKRKKKDIYVCITESLCYTPETNTTLYINFLKSLSCIQFFATLWTIYSPWNSPGHNTGVGSLALLQWIFPTQGSNPGLPHCRQIPYQLSHKGSPYYYTSIKKRKAIGNSLAVPVVRTLHFHCHGPRFNPWLVRKLRSC